MILVSELPVLWDTPKEISQNILKAMKHWKQISVSNFDDLDYVIKKQEPYWSNNGKRRSQEWEDIEICDMETRDLINSMKFSMRTWYLELLQYDLFCEIERRYLEK